MEELLALIVALLFVLTVIYQEAVINFFKTKHLWRHKWVYYNPYDRECSVCGRQEVEHMWREDLPNLNSPGWWEVFDEGDETKHYKKKRWFSRIVENGDIL